MHVVGFIVRIYHDARSPERQIKKKKVLRNGDMFSLKLEQNF